MSELKRYAHQMWWVYVLQGLVTLVLGAVSLFWPGLTLVTLLYALAVYAVIIGITDIVFSVSTMKVNRSWWVMALAGVVLIGVAAYLLRNLDVAVSTFAILVGVVFVVRGTLEVVSAGLGETSADRVLTFVMGALAIVAGITTWAYPISGSLSFVWVLGLFAVIRGALDIANASSLYHGVKEFERDVRKASKA
jgi:uncharacterized membrane protein HdeD (DUF308 family)